MIENYRDSHDGPAFPINDEYDKTTFRGMSVHCYIAAQIAKGLASNLTVFDNPTKLAEYAVSCADSIISCLNKNQDNRKANKPRPSMPKLEIVKESEGAEDTP